MKLSRIPFIGAGTTAFLLLCCTTLHAEAAQVAPPAQPATGLSPQIHEGMSATELQTLIGKPEKILPVATKKGHAEVWLYKKLKQATTDSVKVGTKPVTIKQKQGDNYVDVVVSHDDVLKMRRTEIFTVASFLIVNGQYITCTQTEEKNETFF